MACGTEILTLTQRLDEFSALSDPSSPPAGDLGPLVAWMEIVSSYTHVEMLAAISKYAPGFVWTCELCNYFGSTLALLWLYFGW